MYEAVKMTHRYKPVEVEAIEFKKDCFEDLKKFTEGRAYNFRTEMATNGKFYCDIKTLVGTITVTEGDFIVKGANGEFFACEPDVFNKNFRICDRL